MSDFTDDQYLKLINNTIIRDTNYTIDEFTGGNVQLTCNGGKECRLIKYTVNLLFGYKNNNSRKSTIEIKEELTDIWFKAIQLKMKSKQVQNNGVDFKELNILMNSSFDSTVSDEQLDVNVKTVNVSGSVLVKEEYEHSTIDSNSIVQTTTTTTTTTMIEYFNSKNLNSINIETEFQKFLLYKNNKADLKNRELNWMRWVDNISVSVNNNEKNEYSWQFKKLKSNSEQIENQIFEQTASVAPTFDEFLDKPIPGIGVCKLEHPNFDKKVTIFYKQNGESQKLIEQLIA